jgi:hypothetical protein
MGNHTTNDDYTSSLDSINLFGCDRACLNSRELDDGDHLWGKDTEVSQAAYLSPSRCTHLVSVLLNISCLLVDGFEQPVEGLIDLNSL